jgi:hypothetical protein
MTDVTDRQAAVAGGLPAPGSAESEALVPDRQVTGAVQAVLALADGSVWRGWSVGPARAITGRVRVAGDLVLVEGDAVGILRGVDVAGLDGHLSETAAGQGPGAMGYLAAPGAILPIHVEVARAIARGEIGRP